MVFPTFGFHADFCLLVLIHQTTILSNWPGIRIFVANTCNRSRSSQVSRKNMVTQKPRIYLVAKTEEVWFRKYWSHGISCSQIHVITLEIAGFVGKWSHENHFVIWYYQTKEVLSRKYWSHGVFCSQISPIFDCGGFQEPSGFQARKKVFQKPSNFVIAVACERREAANILDCAHRNQNVGGRYFGKDRQLKCWRQPTN